MIVQELHKIQHEFGYLPREQLFALQERLNAGKSEAKVQI
jgi:NADH:ubiquinone oxidoreductase subunit E